MEAVIWDWAGDPGRLQVRDGTGAPIPHQVLPNDVHPYFGMAYWGHQYLRVLLPVSVPGCGYATYSLTEALPRSCPSRADGPAGRARGGARAGKRAHPRGVRSRTAALVSLVDKASGEEMVEPRTRGGHVPTGDEDDVKGMTAWIVGRWMSVQSVHEGVRLSAVAGGDGLRQWLSYEMSFASSRLKATVSLDRGSAALCWSVECEWLEMGRKGQGVPQLNFFLPLTGEEGVPLRRAVRGRGPAAADMDLPANSWVFAVPKKTGRAASW